MRLELERHTLRLAAPMRAAHGDVHARELIQVSLTDEDGVTGHGEAAPLPAYDGSSSEDVLGALQAYSKLLAGEPDEQLEGAPLLDACRATADVPQALAAVDMALWDRAGRRSGRPIAELLTDTPASEVAVNATLAGADRASVAAQAGEAARLGYGCVKLKVGVGDDAGRVAAVRAAVGPHVALRLDANGAWDVDQAARMIDALAPAGIELVEEPARGLQAIRAVRERVAVRVAIDETAAEPGALGSGVADAVCLKISRCGGISGLLAAATLVRASGAEVYLASTLDGPLGVAAAVHAAAALASRMPLAWCGLATLGLFADAPDALPVRDGAISVPAAGGLGVEPL